MRNVCFSHINEVIHTLNNAEFCSCQNNLHAVTSLPQLFPLIVSAQRGQLHKCIWVFSPCVREGVVLLCLPSLCPYVQPVLHKTMDCRQRGDVITP